MMLNMKRATLLTYLLGLLVFVAALSSRVYYLHEFQCLEGQPNQVWQVQGRGLVVQPPQTTDLDQLVNNCRKYGVPGGYQSAAPLGPDLEEPTAHRAPLYPVFRTGVEQGAEFVNPYLPVSSMAGLRYVQALLGSLTCLLYFLIAWRAFGQNHLLALAAGLLTAFYPMWILNVAECEDGTLTSFLVAWSLFLSVSIGQRGGAIRSLLLGLVLAALSLTRAALLPFAVVLQLWLFLRSRRFNGGWMCGLLTLIGFAGGLAPWVFYCHQTFKAPVPIVTTAWFHLWVGNNEASDGAGYQWSMKKRLDPQLVSKLEKTPQQDRYELLAEPVLREISEKPWETCKRRLKALCQFLLGSSTFTGPRFSPGEAAIKPPEWVKPALFGSLTAMLGLALLGWRWSYGWKDQSAPVSLAIFWIPLPYLLSHAEQLHAARLPLDGVLILMSALGLLGLLPGIGQGVRAGERAE